MRSPRRAPIPLDLLLAVVIPVYSERTTAEEVTRPLDPALRDAGASVGRRVRHGATRSVSGDRVEIGSP